MQDYIQPSENQEYVNESESLDYIESLAEGQTSDLLMDELYSKERGRRVEFFGIQLDEMWSFVQKKANKQWLWLALNPANRQYYSLSCGQPFRCGCTAFL